MTLETTVQSAKQAVVDLLKERRGYAQSEVFSLLQDSYEESVVARALLALTNERRVQRSGEYEVALNEGEWRDHMYQIEHDALVQRIEDGVIVKKSGHQVARFERAGIPKDVLGTLPLTEKMKSRSEQRLDALKHQLRLTNRSRE